MTVGASWEPNRTTLIHQWGMWHSCLGWKDKSFQLTKPSAFLCAQLVPITTVHDHFQTIVVQHSVIAAVDFWHSSRGSHAKTICWGATCKISPTYSMLNTPPPAGTSSSPAESWVLPLDPAANAINFAHLDTPVNDTGTAPIRIRYSVS